MHRLETISARLARLGSDPGASDTEARAAVAAIFRELPGADAAELFFIRRAEHPQDPWSGHIAFPGGRRDPDDTTLLATAMRETLEEVGIDLARADLLGRLPDVPSFSRSKRANIIVTPFVFAVRDEIDVAANVEVAETLWVPLRTLSDGAGKETFAYSWEGKSYDLPCIRLGHEKHVLWGMTYRMLETLLEAIVTTP
jgi:8-oxo-dGTP pyrophosphatase MutT (NUDIX family)